MKTYNVRGRRVVLDREVAAYVGIDTKYLKKVVRRNYNFFEDDNFVFELTQEELLQCQNELQGDKFVSLNKGRGSNIKYLPFAFTAEGISMLEKVLKRSIPIEFEEEMAEVEVMPESWNEGTVVLYQPNEDIKIDVRVENETVWLTQEQMCLLFGVNRNTISHHINNIFKEKELEKISVCQYFRHTATDGKTYTVTIYNLDVIISVGYRVKSLQGTWFRQWANKVIKEHLLYKGSLERRVIALEEQTKSMIVNTENRLCAVEQKVDFIVDTKLPPVEMIFYEGENFKAYDFLCRKREAPLIKMLEIKNDHDRFLIIDETVYHLGPSVKDAGVNRCAVIKMISAPEKILRDLEQCI